MEGRARAVMAAGAVHDETRQDEGHAGDSHDMRKVLGGTDRVVVVGRWGDVDRHVHQAADGHRQKPRDHEGRQSPEPLQRLYHQHSLVIHRQPSGVNCIDRIGM